MRKGVIGGLVVMSVAALAAVVVGCGGAGSTPTSSAAVDSYVSQNLDTSYAGALPASSQLALGTLLLEGSDNAVTPEQAAQLLPLWQSLQGGALQASAEIKAVLAGIEKAMTPAQLQAIAAMRLTQDRLAEWAQSQGLSFAPPGGAGPGGTGGPDSSRQATMQAEYGNLSPEARQTLMAERQATMAAGGGPQGFGPGRSGTPGPGGGGPPGFSRGGGSGDMQFRLLLRPLVELLTGRAAK